MKRKYKIMTAILVSEFAFLRLSSVYNVRIENPIIGLPVAVICFLPILTLLYFLSKEENFSDRKRRVFKFIFWFVGMCTVLGVAGAVLVELGLIDFFFS